MDGEVKAGLKMATSSNEQEHAKEFDRQAAKDGLRHADDLGIGAYFMAANALTTIALSIDDASVAYQLDAKRRNITSSLHSLAVEYFKKNTNQYPALNDPVQKAVAGEELDDTDNLESCMKVCLKDVYADFLRAFNGTAQSSPHQLLLSLRLSVTSSSLTL
ncbi:hypothetical protein NW755_000516 [Fusarium falciforme]|uniref:Uncharacterized protein n=1 Tax=Fusarium falciforme TaxID=195108 RepID=A0A9W8RK11_9HYPO|nr:hypothetical protein NW755_000516 [Fusarium falciforme]